MPIPGEPIATITVNGKNYNNWKTVRVEKEVGRNYVEAQFSTAEPVDIQNDTGEWQIFPGDKCQISLDGTPVINGLVDIREAAFDANNHGVMIFVRSYEAAAGDASIRLEAAGGGQILDGTFTSICNAILQGTGVTCIAPADDGKIIPNFGVQFGESPWDAIMRLARYYPGMRIRADGLNSQLIAFNGSQLGSGINADFVEGKNILSARATIDQTYKASRLTALGQKENRQDGPPGEAGEVRGDETDPNIKDARIFKGVTIEDPATQAMAQGRVGWEKGVQMESIVHATIKVYGWHDDAGKLYDAAAHPGQGVYGVYSPMLGLKRRLWARVVTFEQGDTGTFTTLELCTEESLAEGALRPLPNNGGGPYYGQGVPAKLFNSNASKE